MRRLWPRLIDAFIVRYIYTRASYSFSNPNKKVTLGEGQAHHEVQADAFAMTHALGRTVECKGEVEIVEEAKEIGECIEYESAVSLL